MTWGSLPICDVCWELREPQRQPVRFREQYRENETCCHCGLPTRSGIYVRENTDDVAFPPSAAT